MTPILLDERTWVLVLTGAGVSAESGIPTFRDANGLWRKHRFQDVASPYGFERDPALVWQFYSERRAGARTCEPNAGHKALAALERRLGDRFLLATQNVDGLHRKAGSERTFEIHGCLFRTRCAGCARAPFDDESVASEGEVPVCDACGGRLRPDIVWFGESLDARHLAAIDAFMKKAARGRFVFLAAGTSGVVEPAASFVNEAARLGAETWLVNAEPADNARHFSNFVRGLSGEILPGLFS